MIAYALVGLIALLLGGALVALYKSETKIAEHGANPVDSQHDLLKNSQTSMESPLPQQQIDTRSTAKSTPLPVETLLSRPTINSFRTGTDRDVTRLATVFTAGETIYAKATLTPNTSHLTIRIWIVVVNAPGMTSGSTISNSTVEMELNGGGTALYNFPTFRSSLGGRFNMIAEVFDDSGAKLTTRMVGIIVKPLS
ncbi:MAG TPA: hypothetical protein VGO43_15385 [Pyrinomonadaceae bacterium]|jgi:hypothetical protein|nr:hypothetical protein [Pyrinomonadaceae bacterium]